jgi:hypothetical protein
MTAIGLPCFISAGMGRGVCLCSRRKQSVVKDTVDTMDMIDTTDTTDMVVGYVRVVVVVAAAGRPTTSMVADAVIMVVMGMAMPVLMTLATMVMLLEGLMLLLLSVSMAAQLEAAAVMQVWGPRTDAKTPQTLADRRHNCHHHT